jgi:hypothetical protein
VPHDGFACERDRLTPSLVPYVEPAESVRDEYETNSHDYATLDPIPAMVFDDLDPAQADLIEAFVPHAVEEAGGYAGYRDGATKTIPLLDRLESLALPALNDVREGWQTTATPWSGPRSWTSRSSAPTR